MAKEFFRDENASRYTMLVDGSLVGVLDYSINGDAIALTRAFTQPPFRGRGYAAELTRFAVDDIEATSRRRIVPTCWYVGDWFAAHPERAALLQARPTEG